MAKQPIAGSVKTRLAKDIGSVQSTFFYRHALNNLLRRLKNDTRWRTILAVAPDTSLYSNLWPTDIDVMAQGRGDLGARMQRIFDDLPAGPVIIIGTDIPEITPTIVGKAFQALSRNDAVIGPSGDGGYWLIGQKRVPSPLDIFNNVRWSSPRTYADTLANVKGRSVARAQSLTDVDSGADYLKLKDEASRVILPPLNNIR